MKNLTKEQMKSIIETIGGNEVSNGFAPLQRGVIKLENLTVVPPRDLPDGGHINAWVRADFVTKDNVPAGSASLRSILISPDITWKDENNSQEKRINALTSAELTFTNMEAKVAKTSKLPYKVAHFLPVTL